MSKNKDKVDELVLRVCVNVSPMLFYSSKCSFKEHQGHSINS